ncbi:MarR family winged helix-turn-helix transcriptional regulator [Halopseudomonas aestusnigri]|jgi:DNA-binding MarR family transcriptional regulator|uniref:DNA-binding transcriptional regulator, MarR family n=1 Tax=Halopseudomonas aestusnigri TaxID=857252 RepID=A0AAQ1G6G0_9GAMM|nr:MarR family transcriptional regulator [Halopseudomonas aestusnigri]SEG08663.1 DNA-binding transcriptional regulator, MarR family [Halopseudomonas aestusnigri]
MLPKLRLGFLVADVYRLLRRQFQAERGDHALTQAQSRVLVYIARSEGVRQVELADVLEIKPITLTRLLDQLESLGLIERRKSPADRRAFQLYLRPAAQPYMEMFEQLSDVITARLLDGLTEEEVAVLMKALAHIRERLLA